MHDYGTIKFQIANEKKKKKRRNCAATKDCRRSSNFAGLIFNNRKGREESRPRASTFSLPPSLSPNRSGFCNSLPVDPPLVGDVIHDKGWHMYPYFTTTRDRNPLTHCFRRSRKQWNNPTASHFIAGFSDERAKSIRSSQTYHTRRVARPPGSHIAIATSFRSTVAEYYCGSATADIEAPPSDVWLPRLSWKKYMYWPQFITICHFEKSTENDNCALLCREVDYAFLEQNHLRESDETILSPLGFRLLLIPKRTSQDSSISNRMVYEFWQEFLDYYYSYTKIRNKLLS